MNAYFDTSAFTKLLLPEDGSEEASKLWHESSRIASSRVLTVEARSALAAAVRHRRVRGRHRAVLRGRLESLVERIDLVELTPQVGALAGDLAEAHVLRANDAIHLASALAEAVPELVFVSWDAELRRAASRAGFALVPS